MTGIDQQVWLEFQEAFIGKYDSIIIGILLFAGLLILFMLPYWRK